MSFPRPIRAPKPTRSASRFAVRAIVSGRGLRVRGQKRPGVCSASFADPTIPFPTRTATALTPMRHAVIIQSEAPMLLNTDSPHRFRLLDHCERVPTAADRFWGRLRRRLGIHPGDPIKTLAQLIVLQSVRDNAAALHISAAPDDHTAPLEYLCLSTAQPKHDTVKVDWDELDRAAAKPGKPSDYERPIKPAQNWPYQQVVSEMARRPEIDADWKWYEMIPPPVMGDEVVNSAIVSGRRTSPRPTVQPHSIHHTESTDDRGNPTSFPARPPRQFPRGNAGRIRGPDGSVVIDRQWD